MAKLQINTQHHQNYRVKGRKMSGKFELSERERREAIRKGHWFIDCPKAEARKMAYNRQQFNLFYHTSARHQKRLNKLMEMQDAEHSMGEY